MPLPGLLPLDFNSPGSGSGQIGCPQSLCCRGSREGLLPRCLGLWRRQLEVGPTLGQKPPRSQSGLRTQGTRRAGNSINTVASTFLQCAPKMSISKWRSLVDVEGQTEGADDERQLCQQEMTGIKLPRATNHPSRKTHTERSRPGKGASYYIQTMALTPNWQQGTWLANLRSLSLACSWDLEPKKTDGCPVLLRPTHLSPLNLSPRQ